MASCLVKNGFLISELVFEPSMCRDSVIDMIFIIVCHTLSLLFSRCTDSLYTPFGDQG